MKESTEHEENDVDRLDFNCIRYKEAPIQVEDTISRRKALDKGYKMYWNGVPCEHGHISVRYSFSGRCKKCYQLWRAEEMSYSDISKDPIKTRRRKKKG